ncbi:FtsX-like permease family protein [Streptomyces sp. NPDC126514]|uniref:ABC transporter permease n=1 Tax=Streptomyces sp. NPDC126514 TaxID=3155210 RepID=UPI003326908B
MLRTALRNVLAHKARLIMTVLAVCLGVAFISGSLVFADSTTSAYRASIAKNYADIDLVVEPQYAPGTPEGERVSVLDDAFVTKLAAVPGVGTARPTADGSVTLAAKDGAPLRADNQSGKLAGAYVPGADGADSRHPLTAGRAPHTNGEVALEAGTAKAGGYSLGDTVTLATDGPVMKMCLVGIVSSQDTRVTSGGTLALFDKATAQKLFATPGHYTGIDLKATRGTDPVELSQRVEALLPADRATLTSSTALADQQSAFINTVTSSYSRLPLIFAVVSLFIGSFLIINTFSMLITRRTREIALLRAIGSTRRQVIRSVLAEAAVVGLGASVIGFVLGLGVATGLPGLLGSAKELPQGPLVIGATPVVASLVVGVGITVLAAWLPSRRAARIAPIEAMRGAEQAPSATLSRIRGALGATVVLLGVGLLVSLSDATHASGADLQTAMLGTGALVIGLIMLAPLLAGPVIRLLSRLTSQLGVVGDLARDNALRDPRRTAATAAALMISTALVSGLAVINHSSSKALEAQATAGLSADYVISTRNSTTAIDGAAVQRIAALPGVATASAVADSTISTGMFAKDVSGIDPRTVGDVMKLDFTSGSAKGIGPGRIAVSSSFARDNHVTIGGQIKASIGPGHDGRDRPYTVVGVYEDSPTARDVLADRKEVQQHSFVRDSLQRVLVRTTPDAASADLAQQLRTAVDDSPLLEVNNRAQLIEKQAGVAGDLMTMVFGLLAVGVIISALGMINTLAMSVAERTREIGVLRAIGMDRTAVHRMISLESLTIAAFGTLLGMTGGLFGAWKVGGLANGAIPQYTFSLPWDTLALTVILSLAVGALAAAVPARRAAALSPLRAVSDAGSVMNQALSHIRW